MSTHRQLETTIRRSRGSPYMW